MELPWNCKSQRKPSKGSVTVGVWATRCKKCGGKMDIRQHGEKWKPRRSARYYFRQWYLCQDCKFSQMDEEHRVELDPPPAKELPLKRAARNAYGARAENLRRIGFDSYEEYLDSALWGRLRGKVLARDRHRCYACGDRAAQVHHASYSVKVLKGKDRSKLMSVCAGCHRWAEFGKGGKFKHAPEMATRKLDNRRSKLKDRNRAGQE